MTRADVHYALAIDSEIWEASRVDPSLLDPVVRIDSVPGTTHPFVVVRDYQGPQGYYLESFTISDAMGRELYRSSERKIEMRGQQFENRFVTHITPLPIDRGDDYTLTFVVDGEEVAAIPMFLEVGGGGDVTVMAEETFKQALGKGAIAWVVIPKEVKPDRLKKIKRRPRGLVYTEHQQAVWYVFEGGVVYVFSGPSEQEVDGLTPATTEVTLVARSKDHRSAVLRTRATVAVVAQDDPMWERTAQAGMGRRLNLPDGEGAADRWRENCTLYAFTPVFAGAAEAQPAVTAGGGAAGDAAAAGGGEGATKTAVKRRPEDDIHVEAQVDQATYDRLLAEGKSDRVARAQAKAAYVRAEKKRILGEQQGGS